MRLIRIFLQNGPPHRRYRLQVYVGRLNVIGIWTLAICCAIGCGKKATDRFDLKGKVTYKGQPVPKGYLLFAPDREQGNRGPGSKAGISNGNYETLAGQGHVGGPHKVTIAGFDGVPYKMEDGNMNPAGKPVFPQFETKVDLPKESGTHDFVVPEGK